MEISLLIKSILGLVILLGFLMFLLFFPFGGKKNKEVKKTTVKKKIDTKKELPNKTIKELYNIIKKKSTTTQELKITLESIIKYHGTVHSKLGTRTHPDFDIYNAILFTACRHPNIDKDILLNFDKQFSKLNPTYKQEINEAVTKGLNSRRV